jgi:hypothetical protein
MNNKRHAIALSLAAALAAAGTAEAFQPIPSPGPANGGQISFQPIPSPAPEDEIDADDFLAPTGNEVKDPLELRYRVPEIELRVRYDIQAKLPKAPASLPTYRPVPVDPAAVKLSRDPVAQAFDFDPVDSRADKSDDGASSVLYTDQQGRSIEYFSSGAVFYQLPTLFAEDGADVLKGMDTKSAEHYYGEQADELIRKHALLGGQWARKGVSFMRVQAAEYAGRDAKGAVRTHTPGAAVHYGLSIDGVPAWGPGAKTTVYFADGQVSGYFNALGALQAGKSVDLLSAQSALENYTANKTPKNRLRSYSGEISQAVVEDVQLVYYVGPANSTQGSIAPHYLISGHFVGKDTLGDGSELRTEFQWLEPAVR